MVRQRPGQAADPEAVSPRIAGRNPGTPLDLAWVRSLRVNVRAVDRRVATFPQRRTLEGEGQAASLIRAVTCMDLTALSEDDTPARVRRVCGTAQQPIRGDLLAALGVDGPPVRVAAVCVRHAMVATAVEALAGSAIPVAAVAGGFPYGLGTMRERVEQVRAAVSDGAREIDVVITRSHVHARRWEALYDEVRELREACGTARLKTILATGDLGPLGSVARAGAVCLMAGVDFLKTSTGREQVNATLPVGLALARTIRTYEGRTGCRVGLKPAGGIRTADQAIDWLLLVQDSLGPAWLRPSLFRIGASGLLTDVERRLARLVPDGDSGGQAARGASRTGHTGVSRGD